MSNAEFTIEDEYTINKAIGYEQEPIDMEITQYMSNYAPVRTVVAVNGKDLLRYDGVSISDMDLDLVRLDAEAHYYAGMLA